MLNQLPPQNIEAEESVIGCVLLGGNKVLDRLSNFDPEAFYVKAHKLIYSTALKLHSQQQPVDLLTVSNALGDDLTAIGGVPRLTQLMDSVISFTNADRHANLVSEKWKRRKLIVLAQELIAKAHDQSSTWDELAEASETAITSLLANNQTGKGLTPLSEILVNLWDQVEKGLAPAKPTGLNFLDQCLSGGFRPGELITIAARPAMGKSFVAGFIARTLAEKSPVALFSLEMDAVSIARRMVGSEAGIKQSHLVVNAIPDRQVDDFANAVARLSSLPIYVDDTPGSQLTINRLLSECHRVYRTHGKIGAIVVDYLQLMGDQGSKNRVGEIGKYSSALKSLSKELHCPVVCLSQLSRECEKRNDKRPIMSDIRDSGAIEQDSDVIIFLYRDEYYNKNTDDQGVLELIIRKNRHGQTGTAKAEFNPEYGEIKNYVNYAL